MAVNRWMFTDEFKAEALRLVTVEGHPARQVARDLDIHELLLRRWQLDDAPKAIRIASAEAGGFGSLGKLLE